MVSTLLSKVEQSSYSLCQWWVMIYKCLSGVVSSRLSWMLCGSRQRPLYFPSWPLNCAPSKRVSKRVQLPFLQCYRHEASSDQFSEVRLKIPMLIISTLNPCRTCSSAPRNKILVPLNSAKNSLLDHVCEIFQGELSCFFQCYNWLFLTEKGCHPQIG